MNTETKKIVIKGRVPSKKNSKRIIGKGRRKWIASSKNYVEWENEQLWELKTIKKKASIYNGKIISIVLDFYFPDARTADLTNKAESIMDLLVKAEVIKDDSWKIVPEILLKFKTISRANPRCEVSISYMSGKKNVPPVQTS